MEEYAGKEQHLSGEDEGWVAAGGDGNGGSKDDDAPDMDEIPDISALRVDSGAKDDKNDDDTLLTFLSFTSFFLSTSSSTMNCHRSQNVLLPPGDDKNDDVNDDDAWLCVDRMCV